MKTLIFSEDKRFYEHSGVDFAAIVRALYLNVTNFRVVSGASTISQQLIRAVEPAPRTFINKYREIIKALQMEKTLSKKEILYQYINRLPFGNQIYGVESASNIYFGKSAKDLTLGESVLLVVMPRSPSITNPYEGFINLKKTSRHLLCRMLKESVITQNQFIRAEETHINIEKLRSPFRAPHFTDFVIQSLGKKITQYSVIKTTLDYQLTKSIEDIISSRLNDLYTKGVTNAAVVVIDNKTCSISSMVGSQNYFDVDKDGKVNGCFSKRQPGSTLKPFTYALALKGKMTASTIIPDIEQHYSTTKGDYMPENYDLRFHGPVRLRMALANSLNVPAVDVMRQIGIKKLYELLSSTGFTTIDKPPEHYGLGLTLGNLDVKLLELTNLYSMLANKGVWKRYSFVSKLVELDGKEITPPNENDSTRFFSEEVSYIVSDILADDKARIPAFTFASPLSMPFKVAAKTGTSKNYRDNWTVGYTPEYTVGVWVGDFSGKPMHNVSGITGAGPIFRDVMMTIYNKKDADWFSKPLGVIEQDVCPISGMLVGNECSGAIKEYYIDGTQPQQTCSYHKEVLIDIRNGLLATEGCPEKYIREVSFIEYPKEFYDWAKSENKPLKPMRYSPLCGGKHDEILNNKSKNGFMIIYPSNGDTFLRDPTIKREYENIVFKVYNNDVDSQVIWKVNGQVVSRKLYPYEYKWKPEKGEYLIEACCKEMCDKVRISVE